MSMDQIVSRIMSSNSANIDLVAMLSRRKASSINFTLTIFGLKIVFTPLTVSLYRQQMTFRLLKNRGLLQPV